jgi:uncharacterized membrane protein YqgA involved in biofilm formation
MTGTLVNVATVLTGSLIGLFFKNKLPNKIIQRVFQAIGLFTLYLGLSMALKGTYILPIIFSLILGAITGELIKLETIIERASHKLNSVIKLGDHTFTEGILTSFLLFCIGSMTILGAINEGLGHGSELLMTKALMDGFASIALASAFGVSVSFSVIPLFIFQGGITLTAWYLGSFIPESIILNLSSVGGIILIGLGINILEIKKIGVTNMLPALVWIIPLCKLYEHFSHFLK